MLTDSELEQLNSAWPTLLIIWGMTLASLGIYLGICHIAEILGADLRIEVTFSKDFTFEKLRSILLGVAFLTLFGIHYIRKAVLKINDFNTNASDRSLDRFRPPVFGKYLSAILISMVLSESIGIYGLALFLLGKDWFALYLFVLLSALTSYYFRPKKQELIDLAAEMKFRTASV